ncbi:DUF5666 domain-containing protein [Ampullimonas aquatilis]|uniref:DUF5666 domain-containing protein n=1 Tax=Ampullimonas aquatilis TaxID=1341549 RepID=UPI003C72BEAF
MKSLIQPWLVLSLAGSIAFTGCGGGSGSTTSTSTTSASSTETTATGTVTGFGSVIIDGEEYDTSAAVVSTSTDPSTSTEVPASDVALGMQVTAQISASGKVTTMVYAAATIGRVTAGSATSMTVSGQTVVPSSNPALPTIYSGVGSMADIAVGDLVIVYGITTGNGTITATRIEVKDPSTATKTRVVGNISNLDTAAKTFTIGGLTVNYSATTLIPSTLSLTNDLTVTVWSDSAPTNAGVLTAKVIAVSNANMTDGNSARVGGWVRNYSASNKTFALGNVTVDASTANYTNGVAADLANGRALRVSGSFSNNLLKASTIQYIRNLGDSQVVLTGAITDFVSANNFVVRGVPVSTSGATFVNGTAENLADGVLVRITAPSTSSDGSTLSASKIELITTASGKIRTLAGKVENYDASLGTFNLNKVSMKLASNATFKNSNGTAATVTDFNNDDIAVVRGAFVSGVFTVNAVQFGGGASYTVTGIPGVAYNVNATAGTFTLNGSLVVTNSNTVIYGGTLSSLRSGATITVDGTVSGDQVTASQITITTPNNGTYANVQGYVSDFVSTANLRINEQLVDASNASYINGSAANLADGIRAIATGSMKNGTLVATTITFP